MNTGQDYNFNGGEAGGSDPSAGGVGGAAFTQASIVTAPDITPPPVDTAALLLEGLKSLPEEQRNRMLADFVIHQNAAKKDELTKERERFDFEKTKRFANLKLYGGIAVMGLLGVFILIFGGTFAYLAMKKGLLNDGTVLTGLFGTMVEALRVILSTSSAY